MGLLTILSMYAYYIYFGVKALFGIKINFNMYWCAVAAVFIIFFIVKTMIKKDKIKLTYSQVTALFAGFLLFTYMIIARKDYQNLRTAKIAIEYYTLYCFPSLCLGTVSKTVKVSSINKLLDGLILFLFAGLLMEYIKNGAGRAIGFGGTTYQNYSYAAAYVIIMDLYMMLYADKSELYKLFRMKMYMVVRIVIIPVSFLFLVAGGGRGALVLVAVTIIVIAGDKFIHEKKLLKLIGVVLVVSGCAAIMMPKLLENEELHSQWERSVSFISEDGRIDMENGSSGRDVIYEQAWEKIKESPIYGYGLFASIKLRGGYAHNFFLDILLEGGILYLSLWLFLLYLMLRNIRWRIKENKISMIWLIFFLKTLIELMFSGMYWSEGALWFFLGYELGNKKIRNYLKQKPSNML